MVIANGDVILYRGVRVTVKRIFFHTVYPKYSVITLEYEDSTSAIVSLDECENFSSLKGKSTDEILSTPI